MPVRSDEQENQLSLQQSTELTPLTSRTAINIVTDATLVLLPIPTIFNLKVNIQTKASLIGVLFIGFL